MRSACLAIMGLVCAGGLAAQARVVRPEPPLDSARAGLRDALLVLRDSLGTVEAGAARLQRDVREASGASLSSRARVMQDACARSGRSIRPTRSALLAAKLSDLRLAKRRGELVDALDRLKGTLSRCETDFAAMSQPGQAEKVRGYGGDHALRVQEALRKYEQTLSDFFATMGIRVMPLGATPRSAPG